MIFWNVYYDCISVNFFHCTIIIVQLIDSKQSFSTVGVLEVYEDDFFYLVKKKKQKYTQYKSAVCLLLLTEFVSHCVSNASPHCLRKRSVSCMVALTSHFPMKEQDFAHLSYFSFLLIVRPYLHNDLLSFQLARLSYLFFFLTDLPLSEKKTQRGSPWHFFFFIFPYVLLPHSSISLSLSFDVSLLPPSLDYLLLS